MAGDAAAGVAVTALLIPHGMAFAALAGVPEVTGLYTTIFALVAYAAFGPSRLLLLGPDSSLAPLVAATIALVGARNDPETAIATAGMLSLMTGVACLLAGRAHLGVLSELLSRPVRLGYLHGLAIVVIVGQLPALFGFTVDAETTLGTASEFLEGLADSKTNGTVLLIGIAAVAVIVAFKLADSSIPGVLVAMLGAMAVTALFDLADDGIGMVGSVPKGLPSPNLPKISSADIPILVTSSIGLAFITLTDTMSLSKGFAGRTGETVDPNQEITALGAANVTTALFGGFPVSASTTRTTLAHETGGKTQMVGLIGAGLVACLLMFGSGIVELLPAVALSAVVVTAVFGLFDLSVLRWLWTVRPTELALSLITTVGVVAFGVLEGIVIAVFLSIAAFLRQAWRPYDAVLGRVDRRKGYHDVERHRNADQVPGLLLYRFDAPIFFANADYFVAQLNEAIASAPTLIHKVVVAAEPITDVDSTGAEALTSLLDDLDGRDIAVAFASLKGPVKDRFKAYGLYERLGPSSFHSTIGTAVSAYLHASGVEWVDWTDKPRKQRRRRNG